ncbi:MAG: exodeoxyribonuclease VII large subunit [Deltaproteobacteria bacterium]|nr:exodeoxyribonuclease VII large subunit [Deltaproteobacteria bacterium]
MTDSFKDEIPAPPSELESKNLAFTSAPLEGGDWRAKVPSVSNLTRRLRGHIENSFFDVWVKGEISNFKKPVSGHAYFNLKDANAQLRAVMFRGSLSKLKFQLKDGMEILLHGTMTVYEARGDYQLVADAAEPLGAGALQLAFQQLKARLHEEGLFDARHKKTLPTLPKRIGIVTSSTGAAVKDILKVISRRFNEREILIIPTSVQGDKAAAEIVMALKSAEEWNQIHPDRALEVLIVGRGGGSLEDLWPFNEEIVARAIFKCTIPIISAVGHEIDVTIADYVADLRAPTPSAAAEVVLPKKEDLVLMIEQQQQRIRSLFKKHLLQLRMHLGHLSNRLLDPRERIRHMKERFRTLELKLISSIQNRLKFLRKRLEGQFQMLHSLSPLQVLSRGYSLTQTTENRIIASIKEVSPGQTIVTRLHDGNIYSEILPNPSKSS